MYIHTIGWPKKPESSKQHTVPYSKEGSYFYCILLSAQERLSRGRPSRGCRRRRRRCSAVRRRGDEKETEAAASRLKSSSCSSYYVVCIEYTVYQSTTVYYYYYKSLGRKRLSCGLDPRMTTQRTTAKAGGCQCYWC